MRRAIAIAATMVAACADPKPAPSTPPPAAQPDWKGAIEHRVRIADERLVVDVTLAPGFHAYTIGEETGRPLALSFDEGSALIAGGEVAHPKGITKELATGRSVIVEGRAELSVALAPATPGAAVAGLAAKGKFHYQVCTDTACDRPRSAPFEVKAGGLEERSVE